MDDEEQAGEGWRRSVMRNKQSGRMDDEVVYCRLWLKIKREYYFMSGFG